MENIVIIENKNSYYPVKETLFRPSEKYPEYIFNDISEEKNTVYEMVRNALYIRGYDSVNYGKVNWNPLGDIIQEGNCVLIKPNLVMDVNHENGDVDCLYTNPSIVAAILDYVIKALNGTGKIIVADAPMQECNFDNLINNSGYKDLINYYIDKGVNISIKDLRGLTSYIKDGVHYTQINEKSEGIIVDLKNDSEFSELSDEKLSNLRITNYDPRILLTHHNREKNEYLISKDVLQADVIINVPKPKTHRKGGVTISLKNMIGTNVRKEYLPHHTNGSSESDEGDEYYKKNRIKELIDVILDFKNISNSKKNYLGVQFSRVIIHLLRKINNSKDEIHEGNWYGNDTICRTIIDVNKIINYADKNGKMQNTKQRKMLIVADMIVSGEKEGPVNPSPKKVGVIAMGDNQVLFDSVIAYMMGCNIEKLPTLVRAKMSNKKYSLLDNYENPVIKSNNLLINNKKLQEIKENRWYFKPSHGWEDLFEINKED